MATMFLEWLNSLDEKRDAEKQARLCDEVSALKAQHNFALTKMREQILLMEKANINVAFGLTHGSKRQQELACSIAFYAMSMWQRQAARSVKNKLEVSGFFRA